LDNLGAGKTGNGERDGDETQEHLRAVLEDIEGFGEQFIDAVMRIVAVYRVDVFQFFGG